MNQDRETPEERAHYARQKARAAAFEREHPGGVTRAARARSCRRCHVPVMRGLDGDRCAMEAETDTYPLSAIGEAMAVLLGRQTYALIWTRGRYELEPRDDMNIPGNPPGRDPNIDIVVEHKCGTAPFDRMVHRRVKEPTEDLNAPPPF